MIYSIKEKNYCKKEFRYNSKGMIAQIGSRTGVSRSFDHNFHGFAAWWLWRTVYLYNLPTIDKKLKVTGDWTADLFFKPDIDHDKKRPSGYKI